MPEFQLELSANDERDFARKLRAVEDGVELPTDDPAMVGTSVRMRVVHAESNAEALARARVTALKATGMLLVVELWETGPHSKEDSVEIFEVAEEGSVRKDPPLPSVRSAPPAASASGASASGGSLEHKRTANAFRAFDVVGSYQILKRLGAGGMADVYLVRAMLGEGVDKLVALKTVLPEFGPDTKYGSMFLQEARVSATLRHRGLVQVFGYGEAAGHAYLAMEYLHSRDLTAVLRFMKRRNQPLTADFAVTVALELTRALEYVHGRKDLDGRPMKLVHRDVSPGNVLLTLYSEVKLMDFGVAAVAGVTGDEGLLVGKVPYMTLDQAVGGAPMPRWDLFAVGVMLYEMLTLRRPYANVPMQQFVTARRRLDFPRPSELNHTVPPALDELVMRAVSEGTAFESAAELRHALEQAQLKVGQADLGAWLKVMFGEELAREQAEMEQLTLEARRRTGFKDSSPASPFARRYHAIRRKVASSRVGRLIAQRPKLARGVVSSIAALVLLGGATGVLGVTREGELRRHLENADAQARVGRLVGPLGTEMLAELLKAKQLRAQDPRVTARLALLADELEKLGELALHRSNLDEAAAHFEAALKADPLRQTAKAKLAEVEEEVAKASKAKVVRTP